MLTKSKSNSGNKSARKVKITQNENLKESRNYVSSLIGGIANGACYCVGGNTSRLSEGNKEFSQMCTMDFLENIDEKRTDGIRNSKQKQCSILKQPSSPTLSYSQDTSTMMNQVERLIESKMSHGLRKICEAVLKQVGQSFDMFMEDMNSNNCNCPNNNENTIRSIVKQELEQLLAQKFSNLTSQCKCATTNNHTPQSSMSQHYSSSSFARLVDKKCNKQGTLKIQIEQSQKVQLERYQSNKIFDEVTEKMQESSQGLEKQKKEKFPSGIPPSGPKQQLSNRQCHTQRQQTRMKSQNRNSKLSDLQMEDSYFSPQLSNRSSHFDNSTAKQSPVQKPALQIIRSSNNLQQPKNVVTQPDEFSVSHYTSPRYSNFHSIRETNENLHTPQASSNSTSDVVQKVDTALNSSIYDHVSQNYQGKDVKYFRNHKDIMNTNHQASSTSIASQGYAQLVQNTNPTPKFNLPTSQQKQKSAAVIHSIQRSREYNAIASRSTNLRTSNY